MAKPRIFVSSTYYDLKHLRSSLDIFIESLGFEPILSEKGDIAYTPDAPLDESCYREATGADIFVLVIGGRYGSEASGSQKKRSREFFERYDSITKKEYDSAVARDIPIYILIEANVYSEYQTFLRNKDSTKINYAHVDSVNIFRLIEAILTKPRNNPMHTFERFAEIEEWLREQWAGLFRELLQRQSQQQQLSTLTSQVTELRGINDTLRRYLEAVMTGITPDDSNKLIQEEKRRLEVIERNEKLKVNELYKFITKRYKVPFDTFLKTVSEAKSFIDFANRIGKVMNSDELRRGVRRLLDSMLDARRDFNEMRSILGLKTFRLRRNKDGRQQEN